MIWFTGGFQGDNSELQMMLDVFNRSNVGIFPVDMASLGGLTPFAANRPPSSGPSRPSFLPVAFSPGLGSSRIAAVLDSSKAAEHGGRRATGGGATGGGATGGGATAAEGTPGGTSPGGAGRRKPERRDQFRSLEQSRKLRRMPNQIGGNPNQPNMRDPQFGRQPFDNSSSNRQVLGMLADKTGGFVVSASSDTMEGLGKIGREQEAFYVLGYTPPPSEEGTCHSLKVKVNRGGVNLRSRSGYCNARPSDLLAGNPVEKELETEPAGRSKAIWQPRSSFPSSTPPRTWRASTPPWNSLWPI